MVEILNMHLNLNQLPPIVPGVPLKMDFRVTAILDAEDGLPPSDLTPENACIRVLVYKCGQVRYPS